MIAKTSEILKDGGFSKKEQRHVILAVTFGNILEWYEIYLYIYWSPIIAKLFFHFDSDLINLINTLVLFAIGFFMRPWGGLFFGRLGDHLGRKKAFILSVLVMTIPTFAMGLLPTYAQVGIMAPVMLAFLRMAQSFPAGGELPGAFCFLYESAGLKNRVFMTSWGAVGNQIGIILSLTECYLLETFFSHENLVAYGWRISFFVGGIIGLTGFYLRLKLHETPLFKELSHTQKITKKPLVEVLTQYKKPIVTGILYGAINASAFYLLSVLFPVYFEKILGTSYTTTVISAFFLLIVTTIPLPFFGRLGDKIGVRTPIISSTLAIMLLLYPLYICMQFDYYDLPRALITGAVAVVFTLCVTCITAFLPFLLANLFPTPVRFTCLGFSFNLADGFIGGLSPVIALYLAHITGNQGSFVWILFVCAVVSLNAYRKIQKGVFEGARN